MGSIGQRKGGLLRAGWKVVKGLRELQTYFWVEMSQMPEQTEQGGSRLSRGLAVAALRGPALLRNRLQMISWNRSSGGSVSPTIPDVWWEVKTPARSCLAFSIYLRALPAWSSATGVVRRLEPSRRHR